MGQPVAVLRPYLPVRAHTMPRTGVFTALSLSLVHTSHKHARQCTRARAHTHIRARTRAHTHTLQEHTDTNTHNHTLTREHKQARTHTHTLTLTVKSNNHLVRNWSKWDWVTLLFTKKTNPHTWKLERKNSVSVDKNKFSFTSAGLKQCGRL